MKAKYFSRPFNNLVLIDKLGSLSPIIYCRIDDFANEDTPQLYASCGCNARSSLRVCAYSLFSKCGISEISIMSKNDNDEIE